MSIKDKYRAIIDNILEHCSSDCKYKFDITNNADVDQSISDNHWEIKVTLTVSNLSLNAINKLLNLDIVKSANKKAVTKINMFGDSVE